MIAKTRGPKRPPFLIGGTEVPAGSRMTVDLSVGVLPNNIPAHLPVKVIHGRHEGPVLFVSAAVHGDEVIGVEIARRLLQSPPLKSLRGTLLVVPIVNAYGFLNHSRYLPDRRDLNRSFPGSENGSLASRLANRFFHEVVMRSEFGIDLHSAAIHRSNLPQIRVSPSRPETGRLAGLFGAPIVMKAKLRDGSLRKEAKEAGIDMLLYEAGEALRFDETSVRIGVAGILRVMQAKGMLSERAVRPAKKPSMTAQDSQWMRAGVGGLLRSYSGLGDIVEEGALLGSISDPFGITDLEVKAPCSGIVIGRSNMPVVNEGDALFHIAQISNANDADDLIVEAEPLFDEDEII